jgi:hypothetical protein
VWAQADARTREPSSGPCEGIRDAQDCHHFNNWKEFGNGCILLTTGELDHTYSEADLWLSAVQAPQLEGLGWFARHWPKARRRTTSCEAPCWRCSSGSARVLTGEPLDKLGDEVGTTAM